MTGTEVILVGLCLIASAIAATRVLGLVGDIKTDNTVDAEVV